MNRDIKRRIDCALGLLLTTGCVAGPVNSAASHPRQPRVEFVQMAALPFVPKDFTVPAVLVRHPESDPAVTEQVVPNGAAAEPAVVQNPEPESQSQAVVGPSAVSADAQTVIPPAGMDRDPAAPAIVPGIEPTADHLLPQSPRMFIEYFKPGETGDDAARSVLVPVEFVPPVPATPRSSKAVYRVE